MKEVSQKAKLFLHNVNLKLVQNTLQQINFNVREKKVLGLILQDKTQKEISLELNYSVSYVAAITKQIYYKIYIFIKDYL